MEAHFLLGCLLFPNYLSVRDMLRLGSSSKLWYQALLADGGLVYSYLATHHIPLVWKRIRKCDQTDASLPWKVPHMLYGTHLQGGSTLYRTFGFTWTPVRVTKDVVLKRVGHTRCRECFDETTSKVYASSGRCIALCIKCSRHPDSYSALISRNDIWELYMQRVREAQYVVRKKRVLEYMKAGCKIVRRGGNRACLYWKHDVIRCLFESR